MLTKTLKTFFAIKLGICLLLLSACNFHLQGRQQLPDDFDNVYILSDATHSPITSEITLLLKTNNVHLVDAISNSDVIFHIMSDSQSSKQIGANTTQETRIYRMTYTVTFSLETPEHKTIYGPKTITSSTTNYVYSGQVLGNNQEENSIYSTLRHDSLQKLLLLLSANDVKKALAPIVTSEQPLA